VDPLILAYVNRLSDAFFVFGRWVAATLGEDEHLWQPAGGDAPDWRWKR
jgi:cob(I)alamin adenosyltransferase